VRRGQHSYRAGMEGTVSKEQGLRQQLEWITARHDSGAMSPAVAATVRAIQIEIGWLQHAKGIVQRRATIVADQRHEAKD
jgi:hypothetical protein